MNIHYVPIGDYLIPEFAIALETESLGKYGRMRHSFLKEHRPELYQQLLLSGKLRSHLKEINQTCQARLELLIRQMAEAEAVNEQMKVSDQLEWVTRMNSIHYQAEEVILSELIFD